MPANTWSTDELFRLLCAVTFQNGELPSYTHVTMPGRSHKAVGNTLRRLRDEYGPGGSNADVNISATAADATDTTDATASSSAPAVKGRGGAASKRKVAAAAAGETDKVTKRKSAKKDAGKAVVNDDEDDE